MVDPDALYPGQSAKGLASLEAFSAIRIGEMQHPVSPSSPEAERSHRLKAEVLAFVQAHKEMLRPQFQALDWTAVETAERFHQAIATRLQVTPDPEPILHWIGNTLLQRLFTPEFLEQPPKQSFDAHLKASLLAPPVPTEGIAVLLLDAENLQLDPKEEHFLQTHCPFPIQVKIAFADWRSLGKRDQELHARSYDLIHVPGGKDHADGKMIAMGSSIHERYPQTQAVLVCSSDSIMTSLHNQLRQNEIEVYQVVRSSKGLTLVIGNNGHRQEKVLPAVPELKLKDAIASLENLIDQDCEKSGMPIARLSAIALSFRHQHQLTLKDVASRHQLGKQALSVFEAYPDRFSLHQLGQPLEWFVSRMSVETIPAKLSPQAQPTSQSAQSKASGKATTSLLRSTTELTNVLIVLMKQNTTEAQPELELPLLAQKFYQSQGEAITSALKRLKVSKKFVTFLSACSEFKVRQEQKRYWISFRA